MHERHDFDVKREQSHGDFEGLRVAAAIRMQLPCTRLYRLYVERTVHTHRHRTPVDQNPNGGPARPRGKVKLRDTT